LYRSWPARELHDCDGWQLRYADGFSRRVNSVYPAAVSTVDHDDKLAFCREWYRERGLELVVRQTPATEPGLDRVLADSGYEMEGRTNVLVADVEGIAGNDVMPVGPSADWWAAMADLWEIGPDRAPGWSGIIGRIDLPAAFGLISVAGAPAAVGLAVVAADLLGLFEIIVAPGHRRQGLGRSFTRSLVAWGTSKGATRAYLQVLEDNYPAISMYEQLGFRHEYSYWYRRAPLGVC
jgi:ribosomal protein S18 acetylase RimI-like enzyme